uniref:TIMELESS-interacting protein n=1 Tax=Alona affinis TaxID=381656 RepID=A0A9N6WWQ8_9CRUS|nr:EOG090X0AVC [Alona affinis]
MMSQEDNGIEDVFDIFDDAVDKYSEDENAGGRNESDEAEEDGKGKKGQKNGQKKNPQAPRKASKTGPQLKLDADRLCGPRGIVALDASFQQVKLKGKGYEKENVDIVLKKLEHFAHRLFPKLSFDDCIERVEKLGNSRTVQVYLKRFRMDAVDSNSAADDEAEGLEVRDEREHGTERDPFDDLLVHYANPEPTQTFTQEQQARMAENKKKAEEKRKSRLIMTNQPAIQNSCSEKEPVPVPADAIDSARVIGTEALSSSQLDDDDIMDVDSMLNNIPK